ncbi:hypothetical protein AVEN_273428-1 [Araneus ventricosus]|uniref:Uncharacterized protein n=1 Tax=Araneus ventricosus TaxID=182803 RepID=A0A4Y2DZJ4_ARAVE|nr:hypothetical protein AVEN_273428-1 [Araneus ventricosus]
MTSATQITCVYTLPVTPAFSDFFCKPRIPSPTHASLPPPHFRIMARQTEWRGMMEIRSSWMSTPIPTCVPIDRRFWCGEVRGLGACE